MIRNRILGALAVGFGLLTLFSGGTVLFGSDESRAAAGAIVLWVLWFNFLSGAVYIVAGAGIFLARPWGRTLARLLAAAILVVLAAYLWHIGTGEPWEERTLGALALRLGFWVALALLARPSVKRVGDEVSVAPPRNRKKQTSREG
jgi:hypothetical protein